MKTRKIFILCSFIIIILTLACCSQKKTPIANPPDNDPVPKEDYKQYECFLVDKCLCQHPVSLFPDYNLFIRDTKTQKQELENIRQSITIADINISGLYYQSYTDHYFPNGIDIYKSDDSIYFSLDPHTSDIKTIDCLDSEQFFMNELKFDDIDTANDSMRKIADTYAQELISIDNYSVKVSEYTHRETLNGKTNNFLLHKFVYTKYLSNIPTTDTLTITLSSKGHLVKLEAFDIDKFECISADDIVLEKLHDSVNQKMDIFFKDTELDDFSYITTDRKIIHLKDHIWLECGVNYSYTISDGNTNKHLLTFYVVIK